MCRREVGVLLDTAHRVAAAAARSYVHENGFAKLMFGRHGAEHWFIHVWTPLGDPDVHDHRWDLSSTVLAGRIAVERFEIASGGQSYGLYHHEPAQDDEGFLLRWCEDVSLVAVDEQVYETDDDYRGRAEELHRVRAVDGSAVTFFRHGEGRRHVTRVLRPRAAGSPAPTPQFSAFVPMPEDEFRSRLLHVLEVLA
jgi:hypothetical protein